MGKNNIYGYIITKGSTHNAITKVTDMLKIYHKKYREK